MLSQRVYNILKFFSEQSEPLFVSETKFEYDEILELKSEGYLSSIVKTYYEFKGDSPRGKDAYSITYKGKDALKSHKSERFHRTAGYVISVTTLVATLLSLILTWIWH